MDNDFFYKNNKKINNIYIDGLYNNISSSINITRGRVKQIIQYKNDAIECKNDILLNHTNLINSFNVFLAYIYNFPSNINDSSTFGEINETAINYITERFPEDSTMYIENMDIKLKEANQKKSELTNLIDYYFLSNDESSLNIKIQNLIQIIDNMKCNDFLSILDKLENNITTLKNLADNGILKNKEFIEHFLDEIQNILDILSQHDFYTYFPSYKEVLNEINNITQNNMDYKKMKELCKYILDTLCEYVIPIFN